MSEAYKRNRNVFSACHYQVVWCPKYRRKVLVQAIAARLKDILQAACAEYQAEIEELEVLPDHVHMVVSVDPQFGMHRLVKLLKGRSSRLLRQEFPALKGKLPTLWTHSDFVATVGGAPLAVLKQYIEQQKHVSKAAKKRNEVTENLSVSHLSHQQANEHLEYLVGILL